MCATLLLFMDAAGWWVLDVSLSEQQTGAMLIMFMNAAVGWILDFSWTTNVCYVDNIHGWCLPVGP
jgi:hypothetical protein